MARSPETLEEFIGRAGDSPVLASACLLGLRTRYDGSSHAVEKILALARAGRVIPVCPEQLGGLPTPRVKQGLCGGDGGMVFAGLAKVVNDAGRDVTENFLRGARESLGIAKAFGARFAILKERSPSCGVSKIYTDGELSDGCGVTTAALKMLGVEVFGVQ